MADRAIDKVAACGDDGLECCQQTEPCRVVRDERDSFLSRNKDTDMSYVNSARVAGIVGLAATLFMAGAVMTAAQAGNGGRQRVQAGQGANGSWSRSSTVQRTPSGHMRQDRWQSRDGRTATRSTTVVNDRAAGTRTVDSTATGFNGHTTTYSSDAQRTADGYVRDVARTLPDGKVNQRSIDVSCSPAAQSCTRTVTGGNGG